jgi:hypothetical protein
LKPCIAIAVRCRRHVVLSVGECTNMEASSAFELKTNPCTSAAAANGIVGDMLARDMVQVICCARDPSDVIPDVRAIEVYSPRSSMPSSPMHHREGVARSVPATSLRKVLSKTNHALVSLAPSSLVLLLESCWGTDLMRATLSLDHCG